MALAPVRSGRVAQLLRSRAGDPGLVDDLARRHGELRAAFVQRLPLKM